MRLPRLFLGVLFSVSISFTILSQDKSIDQEPVKKTVSKSVKVENNNTTRPYRRKQAPVSKEKKEMDKKKN